MTEFSIIGHTSSSSSSSSSTIGGSSTSASGFEGSSSTGSGSGSTENDSENISNVSTNDHNINNGIAIENVGSGSGKNCKIFFSENTSKLTTNELIAMICHILLFVQYSYVTINTTVYCCNPIVNNKTQRIIETRFS